MNTIYEDQNVIVYFDQGKDFLEYKWTLNTLNSSSEENVISFQKVMQKIVETKPKLVLNNSIDFKGIIQVENQKKIALAVTQAMIAAGGDKYAAVLPQDLLGELSYEQAKDEAKELGIDSKFQLKYFYEYDEALAWLNA